MGRPKDGQYWNQVTKEENGRWKCKHCNRTFSGSVSRIKAHVDRIKGQGIAICTGQCIAIYSSDRNNEGVHNNMASSSSNPQEAVNGENSLQVAEGVPETIDTSINSSSPKQRENNEIGVCGSSYIQSSFESGINHLNQLVFGLQCEESDIKEQVAWLQLRGKRRKNQVDIWLQELQELKKRAIHVNNSVDTDNRVDIKQLIEKMQKHNEKRPLTLSTEFVGVTFEKNIKQVLKLLADDEVFIIGIYGMGGVGKTLLVTYVENDIKRKGTFKDVFWVTVSHNFIISKLQHDIAKRIGVKLDEDDERIRAADLSLALETKEKSVLILDDVWRYIDLQKLGIPFKVNGIKVMFTTRLKHVCRQMDCLPNNKVKMLPLSSKEARELFMLKLGHNGTPATLSAEVLEIARSIVERCDGLPLGISVMARTMKGFDDIHWWKHAWNKLEKLEMGEELEEVFKVLKRSYDNLTETDMQNCFLYCALLFNLFSRDELIMKLVDNGLINGRSLEEIFDEGHTILNKLEAHSLLRTEFLAMHRLVYFPHRLVTDMACRILKESQRYVMVKYKKGLTNIPHMQEWTADLELVNLMCYNIEEIPEGTSPCCPRLSTLIITEALISRIPECFFIHINVLAVLDLSYNKGLESLPNSVSNLRSLISLVLKNCHSLKYVPPLGDLQALSRLVITWSSIKEVPQGLEMLIKLKWLDLSSNDNLTLVPGFVLPNLTNMQYLDLGSPKAMITAEDVQGMNMLERFQGTFLDSENYNHYAQKIFNSGFGPKTYNLCLGKTTSEDYCVGADLNDAHDCNFLFVGDCEDFCHVLLWDLTDLCIHDNSTWVCLCNALSSKASPSLRRIDIYNCTQLKSLFCLSDFCSLCAKIHYLESLDLEDLESLSAICKEEDVADVPLFFSSSGMFSRLKHFCIQCCHEIEKLLTPRLVKQLRNLETITVQGCCSMKEIFAMGDDGYTSSIELPKLTRLELSGLPQLKTVSKGIILCGSSPKVSIDSCPNLERKPTIEIKPF